MFEDLVIQIKPIGWVESDFKIGQKEKTKAILHIFDEYAQGLFRLDEFKYIMVIFYFHKFNDFNLIATPPHNNPDKAQYGVFATHSPKRPNHIGVSTVPILEVGQNYIKINNCDMIYGTPILDIKAQRN
ncbi:tRNA (N6-threonylcarbamoyladenosine(37)-N6)-methyltransferase TrmO [Desulfurella sp.]|uniref:tRNA (N6-threonylcarbamoyladenosine(37)-N6)-methyltransferase TrmO n=1 Tax=Desulfurella sp. TaxID=1962857 RepID=UPI0025BEEADB|nr:tRNA (N6-threonylcarbamoyladenosine(37)-N6)-methyltransferase TrmO [Desulfurella sp.]